MLLILVLVGIVLWLPKLTARALKQSVRIAHGSSWSRFTTRCTGRAASSRRRCWLPSRSPGWYLNLPKWVTPIISSVMTVSADRKPHSATPPEGVHAITPAQAMTAAQREYPGALVTRIGLPRKPGDVS